MNPNITMFLIAIVALIIGAGGTWFLTQKGKDPKALLGTADTVIDGVKSANDTFGKLIPAPLEFIIDKVLQTAQAGVHAAQQLYDSSQLTEDQRKQKAFDTAMNLLKIEGYTTTPELEAAVKDAIETGVFVMKNIVKPSAINTGVITPAEPQNGGNAPAVVDSGVITPAPAETVSIAPKTIVDVVGDALDKVGETARTLAVNDLTNKIADVVQGAIAPEGTPDDAPAQ